MSGVKTMTPRYYCTFCVRAWVCLANFGPCLLRTIPTSFLLKLSTTDRGMYLEE